MSDPSTFPLPPEIDELLALERDAYGEAPVLKAAVLSHVETSVTLRGPSGGGSAPSGAEGAGPIGAAKSVLGPASKTLAAVATGAFVTGALVGGLAVRALGPSPAASPVLPPSPTIAEVAPQPPPLPVPESSVADSGVASIPRAATSAESRAKPAEVAQAKSDLVREREVIDAARAALARGRSADALSATARHAERWPRGQLAEEREVLAIQALASLGRRAEAERRAAAFKRAFPSSVLTSAVDLALSTP